MKSNVSKDKNKVIVISVCYALCKFCYRLLINHVFSNMIVVDFLLVELKMNVLLF